MAGDQHEAVGKGQFGLADVPAHGTRQGRSHQTMDLAPATSGMAALPIVQHQVDELVDAIFDQFPMSVILALLFDQGLDLTGGFRAGHGRSSRCAEVTKKVGFGRFEGRIRASVPQAPRACHGAPR